MERTDNIGGQARRRLAACAMAAALALAAGCGGKGEAELIASAKTYLEQRDAKAAVIQLKNVLEKNPESGEARFLLGKALLESGDAAGADVELKRALEYRYPEAQVVPVRAKALLALGQPRKLLDEYGSADMKDPLVDIEIQVALAQAHAALGAHDEAREAVKRALAISPVYAPAVLMQAKLQAVGGDIDAALATTDGLLARAADNTDGLQFKADLLLHGKGDRAGALALYRKAVAVNKDLAEAHASIFTLLLSERDLDGAGKQLEEIKKQRANHPRTKLMEAQYAFAKGDYKAARELTQLLLRGAPDNPRVLQLAGAVEFQLGSMSQAETLLARSLQLAPGASDARRLLAETYLRMRQPAKSLSTLKPLLEQAKPTADVLALAAQAHLLDGDIKTAQQLFTRAAQIKPDDKRLNAAVALSRIGQGNADAAFAELQKLAAADAGRSVDLALISARLQRREFDSALSAIAALERKQPDNPMPLLLRGRVLGVKGDLAGARKAFEAALAKDPKYLPALSGLAAADLQEKKPDAARQRFEDFIKREPKHVQALMAFAEFKRRTGAPSAEVTKLYADAVAAGPGDTSVRLAQIDHLTRIGDKQAALAAAQAADAAFPNNLDLLERLGRAQLAAGDRQQALSSYGKITAVRPDLAAGHLGIATVQMAAGDSEAALRAARKAMSVEPNSVPAHRMVISLSLQQKLPQQAIETARQLQQRRPDDATGFLAEGDVEASQKRWDPAIAAYRKALDKSDPSAAAMRLHGTLLLAQRGPEAAKFAEGWLKQRPTDHAFRFHLGDTALSAGDMAAAEARYAEVAQAQPDNALALNNIAWLRMKQKKPGALDFAERAVKAAPEQPAIMDTLAMVLSAEQKHPRAIEVQKQVVAKSTLPGFRLNLARIYLAAGDKPAARQELEALAKLKDFPAQAEVSTLLKQAGG